MGYIANLVLFYVTVSAVSKGNQPEGCDTEQYLNVGRRGIINCSFDEHFFGVFWYDSLDSATTYPLISLQESVKSGDGYISGQYDVLPNGSLVIRNVSFENDHMFRAILLKTKEDDSIVYDVRLHVTVKSDQPFPYIDVCGEEPFCFVNFSKHKIVSCAVHGTQPAVEISWAVHNESGVWRLPSKTNELPNGPEGHLSSTTASTSLEYKPLSRIEHLVCTVNSPPNIIAHVESNLFLENAKSSYSLEESITKHVQVGTRFVLTCSIKGQTFIIWKKKSSNNQWQTIAHVFFGDTVFLKTYSEYYSLDKSGALMVPFAQIFNEGSYMCIYHENFAKSFEVIVYVSPQPPYVTIEGCKADQQCSLKVPVEGNLTCSVQRIWPKIKLELIQFPESSTKYIKFFGQDETVEKTGDTYNIILKSHFVLKDLTQSKITIACRVSGWDKSISDLDRTLDLYFAIEESKFPLWIIILILLLSTVMMSLFTLVIIRRKKASKSEELQRDYSEQSDDEKSMPPRNELEDKEKQQDTTPDTDDTVEHESTATENTRFLPHEEKQEDATPDVKTKPRPNAHVQKNEVKNNFSMGKAAKADDTSAINKSPDEAQTKSHAGKAGAENTTTGSKNDEIPPKGIAEKMRNVFEHNADDTSPINKVPKKPQEKPDSDVKKPNADKRTNDILATKAHEPSAVNEDPSKAQQQFNVGEPRADDTTTNRLPSTKDEEIPEKGNTKRLKARFK